MDALDILSICLSHLGTHLDVIERGNYPSPAIETDKYAYAVLVMKGDFYVPGALTMATSLKKTGTQHDIVCMVTGDVSKQAKQTLNLVFDKVVDIDYISEPYLHLNTAKEEAMYHSWMREALTLYRCLWLFEYKKVCLLDSDIIVIRNMDNIFELSAPAGSFHSFWLKGHCNPYPSDLKHGDTVPTECIERALHMKNSFVCIGNCLLLPPGKKTADEFITYINHFISRYHTLGFHNCNSGTNEQAIAHFFANWLGMTWTHIGTQYQCIPWKYSATDPEGSPYLFHYFNIKPWAMDIHEFPDLQVWWASAKAVCDRHPEAAAFFTPTSRKNLSPSSELLETRCCLWCKGNHKFIDFNTNTITCPEIAAKYT